MATMGNLHAGHLALVRRARELGERVVVSVFVNPTQFAPGEDFETYPRTLDADQEALVREGVDVLFAPPVAELYPDGPQAVTVHVDHATEGLESASRPHFFAGVTTVVAKLLAIVRPEWVVFGKKDYQQWVVVRRLVRNLLLDTAVVAGETVREADGLALSSRNGYLDSDQRQRALGLYQGLQAGAAQAAETGATLEAVTEAVWQHMRQAGLAPEYAVVRRAGDLETVTNLDGPRVLLAAAHVDEVRLIDNLELTPGGAG
jgi:pantoate--beta-alanine ligase